MTTLHYSTSYYTHDVILISSDKKNIFDSHTSLLG